MYIDVHFRILHADAKIYSIYLNIGFPIVAVSGGHDFSIAVIRNDQLSGGETLACLNDLTACRLANMPGADTERSDSEAATRLARTAAISLGNACAALGRSRSELLHARPSPPRTGTLWFVSLNTLSAIVARGGGGYPGETAALLLGRLAQLAALSELGRAVGAARAAAAAQTPHDKLVRLCYMIVES